MRIRSLPAAWVTSALVLAAGLTAGDIPAAAAPRRWYPPRLLNPPQEPVMPQMPRFPSRDTVIADVVPAPPMPRSMAIFRPVSGTWQLREADGSTSEIRLGGGSDEPVPADYDGTGYAQVALFRRASHRWLIRGELGKVLEVEFGARDDVPVPGDYRGDGSAQIAVFRPTEGNWLLRGEDDATTVVPFGLRGDVPVAADYLGLGRLQIAVYRPSAGKWLIRTPEGDALPISWGAPDDRPVPADYSGSGHAEIAVYRPSTGEWWIRHGNGTTGQVRFGGPDDQPMPGDYLGLGFAQIAVYRSATGEWLVRSPAGETLSVPIGQDGDVPIAAHLAPSFGVWQGAYSGLTDAGAAVIRTQADWEGLWARIHAAETSLSPAPAIDFSKAMLVAVFMGERPTGGYGIQIADVSVEAGELHVTVRAQAPPPGECVSQVITQPYCVALVPKSDLPVRFVPVTASGE